MVVSSFNYRAHNSKKISTENSVENTFLFDQNKTLYCLKYEAFVLKKSLDKMDKTIGLFHQKTIISRVNMYIIMNKHGKKKFC